MGKALVNLRKLAIVLALLTVAGFAIDYVVDKSNAPAMFTLIPICLLITTLLVMLVIWLFRALIQPDR